MATIARNAAAALALALAFASPLYAQNFPSKPVRLYISFPPGSSTDVVSRLVGASLSQMWGQPVVAENRPGAGGSIASAAVVRSAPDGYTLLVNSSSHTINPSTFAQLPYDTARDFTDISPLTVQPNVLVVAPESPHKTLKDLIAYARAKPGALKFAHAGAGSGTHLHSVRLATATGIDFTSVPYKGTPEIVTAIMGGTVDCYWLPISAGIGMIRGGKLRALAIGADKRSPLLPDVPTTKEAGFPDADIQLWFGLWGPAGMPPAVVTKISNDVRKALADPGMREKLANLGSEPLDMSPEQFAKFVRSETEEYRRLLAKAGVKPQ